MPRGSARRPDAYLNGTMRTAAKRNETGMGISCVATDGV